MVSDLRRATAADIPQVIDWITALACAVEGPQQVCRARTGEVLAGLIASADGIVLVSDGGFIAGCITQTVISPQPVAVELGWYATNHSGVRLLRAFEGWARDRGAALIKMSCHGGAAQRLLERAGYRVAEIQMVR